MHSPTVPGGEVWPPSAALLEALPRATLAVDLTERAVTLNEAAVRLLGRPREALLGRRLADVVFEPDHRGGFAEVLARAAAGHEFSGPLTLQLGEAAEETLVSVAPVADGTGTVRGTLVSLEPIAATGGRDRLLAQRLGLLASATGELLAADDLDTLTQIVIGHLGRAAGATVASLMLVVGEDTLEMRGLSGGRPGAAKRWARFAVDDRTPAGVAVSTRRPVVLTGRAEIQREFPGMESAAEGERSMVALPMVAGPRVIGVIALSFPGLRRLETAELDFLRDLTGACAQAVDRIRAREQAADRAFRLQFLADASAELAGSLDYESTLAKVAWLAVPRFADWATVSLDQDGALRTLAIAHADPRMVAVAERLQQRYPPDPNQRAGSYEVMRTGRSELYAEITDDLLAAGAKDEEHLRLLRGLDLRSALTVPLVARGRPVGTMAWVRGQGRSPFGDKDVAFGEDLARRAAVAIDNAQLHSELRTVSTRLQQAILPPALPTVHGWELAALYVPAGDTVVGGDFYDVVALDADRFAVFVGDVMGRGIQVAVTMAQVRVALRTLIGVDPTPRVVLDGLDRVVETDHPDQLISLLYATADSRAGTLRLAQAGHPLPVLVHGGRGRTVDLPPGVILGAGGDDRQEVTVRMCEGDVLLLFTDGLVERRGEDLDAGQQRLVEACDRLDSTDLTAFLQRLSAAVRDRDRDDDVAILALRRTGS